MNLLHIVFFSCIYSKKITKAGTIPVIDGRLVVFITSLNHPGRLVLPKGKIKKWESPVDAAVRETGEESGAMGKIEPEQAYYSDSTVYYYLKVEKMEKEFYEHEAREVHKLTFEEVENSLRIIGTTKRIVKQVKERLGGMPKLKLF